jgi:hypothetical protein
MFYAKTLDARRLALLKKLVALPQLQPFYLAGGTALSLQLGLRKSVDFDFFSYEPLLPSQLKDALLAFLSPKPQVITLNEDTCDLDYEGIPLRFFSFHHALLAPLVQPKEVPHLSMASLTDLAAMKFMAIGGRSAKKDFFDLYHLLSLQGITALQLVTMLNRKYGKKGWSPSYYVMSLTYFEPAEAEASPQSYVPFDWEAIKAFFVSFQQSMLRELEAAEA